MRALIFSLFIACLTIPLFAVDHRNWHNEIDRVYVEQPWFHQEFVQYFNGSYYPQYYGGRPYFYYAPQYYYYTTEKTLNVALNSHNS
jgi:hypothetical protein